MYCTADLPDFCAALTLSRLSSTNFSNSPKFSALPFAIFAPGVPTPVTLPVSYGSPNLCRVLARRSAVLCGLAVNILVELTKSGLACIRDLSLDPNLVRVAPLRASTTSSLLL